MGSDSLTGKKELTIFLYGVFTGFTGRGSIGNSLLAIQKLLNKSALVAYHEKSAILQCMKVHIKT
jgi:hypothetical protein